MKERLRGVDGKEQEPGGEVCCWGLRCREKSYSTLGVHNHRRRESQAVNLGGADIGLTHRQISGRQNE